MNKFVVLIVFVIVLHSALQSLGLDVSGYEATVPNTTVQPPSLLIDQIVNHKNDNKIKIRRR
jgi:hypothetical protein